VGFEPTTPVFERAKKVIILERGVTAIGYRYAWSTQNEYAFD
jgi:hypothetical protein